jgi:hypothetical protein
LASFGSSALNTSLSRSISLTWMDQQRKEIPLPMNLDHPFEIVIPRDPSLIIPPLSMQNVTSHQGFNFHYVDLNLMSSIHFDIHPLNINLSLLFTYRFNRARILNSSEPQIDGWTIFSPSSNTHTSLPVMSPFFSLIDLTNWNLLTYFLGNEQTLTHNSLIFALRQLNDSSLNPPSINEVCCPVALSSVYMTALTITLDRFDPLFE